MIVAAIVVGGLLAMSIWTYAWAVAPLLLVTELMLICAVIAWSIWQAARGDGAAAGRGTATVIAMLAGMIGMAVFLYQRWAVPPARLERQALVGQSAEQIVQRLGRPYYDSREDQEGPSSEFHLTYTFGLGGHCIIMFDEKGVAVDARYGHK